MADTPEYLTREAAADWLNGRGIVTISAASLAKLAAKGRGPEYCRLGRHVFYRPADLESWLAAAMRPVTDGREPVRV